MPIFVKIGQSVAKLLQFFVFFSRWQPSAILDLFVAYGGLYHCAKFGDGRCSSLDNMNVSIFGAYGWKTHIHALKIVVFELCDSINWLRYQQKPNYVTFGVCM